MREYYHFYPVCPRCHEPAEPYSSLSRIDENILKCGACNVHFPERINLTDPLKFPRTIEYVRASCGGEEYLKAMPLIWRVDLNFIERQYLAWIQETRGKFLITWPWNRVKFIPILVSEFLLNDRKKKAVVICSGAGTSTDREVLGFPEPWVAFEHLIYLKRNDTFINPGNYMDEIRKADSRRFYFPKVRVTCCVVRDSSTGKKIFEKIYDKPAKKCRNKILKEIYQNYGYGSVRYLQIIYEIPGKKRKSNKCRLINKKGLFDVELIERFQRTCKRRPRYRWEWLWQILLNCRKIGRPSKNIRWNLISAPEDLDKSDFNKRLLFINSDGLNPEDVFNMVNNSGADLVVIDNMDRYIKDKIHGGKLYRSILQFIRNTDIPAVLLFSVDRESRRLYGLPFGNILREKFGVIPHTLDNEYVIERIRKDFQVNESKYSNPFSSKLKEIMDLKRYSEIEYMYIKDLSIIDEIIEIISKIKHPVVEGIIKFLKELRRSPLPVYEQGAGYKFYRSNLRITFDYMLEKLKELEVEEEKIYRLKNLFVDGRNPLLEWLVGYLQQLPEDSKIPVIVVVHGNDRRGLERILSLRGFKKFSGVRPEICKWNDVFYRQTGENMTDRYMIISVLPPPVDHTIREIPAEKIIFAGSEYEIDRIKKIVKYRISGIITRPLYRLSRGDPAPEFLKNILSYEDIPFEESIEDLLDGVRISREFSPADREANFKGESILEGKHSTLKPGQKALLLVDISDRGVFIPWGSLILIWDGEKLSEVTAGTDSQSVEGKMLVEKRGLYIGAKHIFVEFMVSHGNRIPLESSPFRWRGFIHLYLDSIKWILLIQKAIDVYSIRHGISRELAKEEIAGYISQLNLTARDPDYIKTWWSQYEIVITPHGNFPIYQVEHPKSPRDLEKLYMGLSELCPEIKYDAIEPRKTYAASRLIQELRRSMLRGDMRHWDYGLYPLFEGFRRKLEVILKASNKIRIRRAVPVRISRCVESFKFIDNYNDYFDQIYST